MVVGQLASLPSLPTAQPNRWLSVLDAHSELHLGISQRSSSPDGPKRASFFAASFFFFWPRVCHPAARGLPLAGCRAGPTGSPLHGRGLVAPALGIGTPKHRWANRQQFRTAPCLGLFSRYGALCTSSQIRGHTTRSDGNQKCHGSIPLEQHFFFLFASFPAYRPVADIRAHSPGGPLSHGTASTKGDGTILLAPHATGKRHHRAWWSLQSLSLPSLQRDTNPSATHYGWFSASWGAARQHDAHGRDMDSRGWTSLGNHRGPRPPVGATCPPNTMAHCGRLSIRQSAPATSADHDSVLHRSLALWTCLWRL